MHDISGCYLYRDLPDVVDTDDTSTPLLLIDTAGCDLNELDVASNESKGNEGEYLTIIFATDRFTAYFILLEIGVYRCG